MEREDAGELRTWQVRGMDCAGCVAKVERAVSRLPGVQDVRVNLMTETLTARIAPGNDLVSVAGAVGALGYPVSLRQEAAPTVHNAADHAGDGHVHAHVDNEEEPGMPWWQTGKARL